MKPGIYNVSGGDYHSGPGISKSGLDHIAQSPAHFQAYLQEQKRETPALVFGRLAHTAILEPERYADNVAVAPTVDRRTKEGKAKWERFQECCQDREIISETDANTISAMATAVRNHRAASLLLSVAGRAEQSCYWIDQYTGKLCKCRPDFLREDGIVVDLKTTLDASPQAFHRSVAKYRYHVQAAYYIDGLQTHLPDVRAFVFVVVEKQPPYGVATYVLDYEATEIGRDLYRKNLLTYSECKARQSWPCYSTQIETLSLPRWAVAQAEEEVTA